MTKRLPVYTDDELTYEADTCLPLEQAAESGDVRFGALVHVTTPVDGLPRGALSGLKTVGLWDAEHDQQWGLPWHRNEGIELTYLERGTLPFAVDNHRCMLHPDALTITRPWQPHRVGDPLVTAGRLHWVILDVGIRHPHQSWRWPSWLILTKDDIQELTGFLSQNEQPVWQANESIRLCFQRIACVIESDEEEGNVSWLAVHLNELLLHLLCMFREQRAPLDDSLTSTDARLNSSGRNCGVICSIWPWNGRCRAWPRAAVWA